jgi:hypothetical protein
MVDERQQEGLCIFAILHIDRCMDLLRDGIVPKGLEAN